MNSLPKYAPEKTGQLPLFPLHNTSLFNACSEKVRGKAIFLVAQNKMKCRHVTALKHFFMNYIMDWQT